jgi:hypothetical protein
MANGVPAPSNRNTLGFLGALGGMAAAAVVGGNSTQIVNGGVMGAALSADPAAAAAPAYGTSNLPVASALGNTANAGSTTRPNLALGDACPGFTEANYMERATSASGEEQLYTLCGQAFNYYVAYKEAVRRGVAQGDVDRIYAAHESAARVARGFRAETRVQ